MASQPDTYKEKVKRLSDKYLDIQGNLVVLSDVNWKPSVKEKFKKSGYKSNPDVTKDDYEPSIYHPEKKTKELEDFIEEVEATLGPDDPVGRMLVRNSTGWIQAIKLVQSKGTPEFYENSKKLYGSSEDKIFGMSLIDIALKLDKWLTKLEEKQGGPAEKVVTSKQMVTKLRSRLKDYFGKEVTVNECANMGSDANAGLDSINIRKGAKFRLKDVGVFEVHEGWVHMGSAMNGQQQPYMEFLKESCPGTDTVQEGLGAFTEVVTLNTYPARARKIVDRVIAINMAENGASFLEVFNWYLKRRNDDVDSAYVDAARVFHGTNPKDKSVGPFTRDIIYLKGFLQILKFLTLCFEKDATELVEFLFLGNIYLEDIPSLYVLTKKGLANPPKYVPSLFTKEGIESLATFLAHFAFVKDKLLH